MYTRDQTKTIYVGGIPIGGGNPVTIQSMTNTDTRNISATRTQIQALADAGCEIVRVAVPDNESAEAFKEIKKLSPIPVVADIHFDYRLALAAIKNGADKLRINPGNIGGENNVRMVAEAAKSAGIPIRVGVNGGSLEKELLNKYGGVTAEALCESILRHVKMLESNSFYNIALAIKTSNVPLTLAAHRLLCEKLNYPLHIGITEAGTPYRGTIKSAVGIGALLAMGIGDTVRVSLTGDPIEEVRVAKEILQAFGLRSFGPKIISCPTCGRCKVDLAAIAQKVESFCDALNTPITVAVMGCVVNGPGEAREADLGLACGDVSLSDGKVYGVIFQKGQIVEKVSEDQLAEALITRITALKL
ncbi:MAG: flavodoxin-dependent (E)-4-hydroxy-3-methylbut-2-enyl-diphosphate synthase [Defluviitaleaceae bacterium]|nr:flavodoxin-dependent (E)-4-hydroxy-3-methylbut-2-enyl-diphosphate synthase [Defluviitaleaceae bacterium]